MDNRNSVLVGLAALVLTACNGSEEKGMDIEVDGEEYHLPHVSFTIEFDGETHSYAEAGEIAAERLESAETLLIPKLHDDIQAKNLEGALSTYNGIVDARTLALHVTGVVHNTSFSYLAQTAQAIEEDRIVDTNYSDEELGEIHSGVLSFYESLVSIEGSMKPVSEAVTAYGPFMSAVEQGLDGYEGKDLPQNTYRDVQDTSNSLLIFGKNRTNNDGSWTLTVIHEDAEYAALKEGKKPKVRGTHTELTYNADNHTFTVCVEEPNAASGLGKIAGENMVWASNDIGLDGLTAPVEGLHLGFDPEKETEVNATYVGHLNAALTVLEARYDTDMFQLR